MELTGGATPVTAITPVRAEALRQTLVADSAQLAPLLSPSGRPFSRFPRDPRSRGKTQRARLAEVAAHYEQVSSAGQYRDLAARPEFQATLEVLREYVAATRNAAPALDLPPPPVANVRR